MHHCPTCGHHHGYKDDKGQPMWPRCMAIAYNDHDAVQKCACEGGTHYEMAG